MKKNNSHEEKLDLRHDTMEFSASTDGDDILDSDIKNLDDDDISAEELDFFEGENEVELKKALRAVEKDRLKDQDYLSEDEEWTDDLPDAEEEIGK